MAVKIAVVERKGGVGKTTIAAHLAGGLALAGEDVLMIDTDSQGHLSKIFGQQANDNFYRWMVEGATDVIGRIPRTTYDVDATEENRWNTSLHLIAAHKQTWIVPFREQDPFAMLERIAPLDERYNTIIIDTAPTYSMLDAMIYLAADYFLVVAEMDTLSLDGLDETIASISRYTGRRKKVGLPESAVMGIIPNKMRASTSGHRVSIKGVAEKYGPLIWQPVGLRAKWAEASMFGEMVYRYAPRSVEAQDAMQIVNRVSEVMNVGV